MTEDVERLSPAAVRWLVDGEKGRSSQAIFDKLALGRPVDEFSYPADIDDYQRCERLLRAVPELRESFVLMAGVGWHWRPLIEVWDEVARILDEDAPGLCDRGWSAVPYGERMERTRRASAVFSAAYERGWKAYRASGDTRSARIGRMTVTALKESKP